MSSFKRIGVNLRLCMSVSGTSRHFVAMRNLVVIGAWRTSTKPHQSSSIYRVRALAKHPKRRLCEIGWRHHGTKCLPRSRAAHDVAGRRKITEHRQRDLPCPALLQKIIRFRRRANQFYQLAPSFPCKRGVSRSSRTREGMRWTRQRRRASAFTGRSPVSELRRAGRTALVAYGKTVWSRHPLLVPSCRW